MVDVTMRETAYAKINLALHVRRRREDGYHELETLFAFVDNGDVLVATSAEADSLHISGEFGGLLQRDTPLPKGDGLGKGATTLDHSSAAHSHPDPPPQGEGGTVSGNIVAKALTVLPRADGLSITLEKRLPVAAGLGGGSADAGAVFRIVRELHGLPDDWMQRAASLGADVPACVDSVTCVGRGTGAELEPADNDLSGTPVLLVNPRVPLSTGPVFKEWDGQDRGALPGGTASEIAQQGRNDLEAPAIQLCPPIARVLAALRETGTFLVRMSGSGATCFALYSDESMLEQAAETIRASHPEWWQMQGRLR